MNRFAIIVGVENYDHFSPTGFCHADADLMHRTLVEECDFVEHRSLLLKLSPETPSSPSEILGQIKETVSSSERGDTILFYFAGHGGALGGNNYLILPKTDWGDLEKTALALHDVSNELRENNRICCRIFDACHSGKDVRGGTGAIDSSSFIRNISQGTDGWLTLAACGENEYSIPDSKLGHGVFTYYLCSYIKSLKNNDEIYPEAIKLAIVDQVLRASEKLENPQNVTLNASLSGKVAIAKRKVSTKENNAYSNDGKLEKLHHKIKEINDKPDILKNNFLEDTFQISVETFDEKINQGNPLNLEISKSEPIGLQNIPRIFLPEIYDFKTQRGIQPRHQIKQDKTELEDFDFFSGIVSAIQRKKKPVYSIKYFIYNSEDCPDICAKTFKLQGDGRCTPNVEILIYVLPLQITACVIFLAIQKGWKGFDDNLGLLLSHHLIARPNDEKQQISEFGKISAEKVQEKILKITEVRLTELERELNQKI